MTAIELLQIISLGETSEVQFKREIRSQDHIAPEMIAMSNAKGGMIVSGVDDSGIIVGLDDIQLRDAKKSVTDAATDLVKPQIFVTTEVVMIDNEKTQLKVLIVHIDEGVSKPYKDNKGVIWLKQGDNTKRLTDNHEQIRLFQQSGLLYVDEVVVPRTSVDDVDFSKVKEYIKAIQNKDIEDRAITETLLTNLNIVSDGHLTLGGLLFFANHPQKRRPVFCVKAVSFFGNTIGGTEYRSSQDIEGTIPEIFEETMRFLTTNLRHVQAGQNFNSVGKLEISKIALEELVQNALIHRDYSKNSPVRIMIFDNRVEMVSPGSLPNKLTVEKIKMGSAVVRNNLLASYCSKLMTYRGLGTGITRALDNQPNVEFVNDVEGEQFKVIIPRPAEQ